MLDSRKKSIINKSSERSFYRLDPLYRPKEYDKDNKVLPLSPSIQKTFSSILLNPNNDTSRESILNVIKDKGEEKREEKGGNKLFIDKGNVSSIAESLELSQKTSLTAESNQCYYCLKTCKTKGGLKIHQKSCKKIMAIDHNEKKSTGDQQIIWKTDQTSNFERKRSSDVNKMDTTALQPIQHDPLTTQVTEMERENMNIWNMDLADIMSEVSNSYNIVIKWKKNLFKLPSGNAGKRFICEMTRQINLFTTNSSLQPVALKCLMIMPHLLLQKPSLKSKSKDHTLALQRRLQLWEKGKIDDLVHESRTIQN